MNVRKLLQTEIWSKRTTRKMLVGIGIVAVLFMIGYGVWYEVEVHWLTQGERNAAKDALKVIDALQDAGLLNDEEFEVRARQAEAKVKAADEAAKTFRDESVEMKLSFYLIGVESERWKARRRQMVERGLIHREPVSENEKKIDSVMSELKKSDRSVLHQMLD